MVGKATQWAKTMAYLDTNHTATVRELFGVGINSPTKRISELNGRTVRNGRHSQLQCINSG